MEAGPEGFGFETVPWTAKLVRAHIERRFGVDYSVRGVQDLLYENQHAADQGAPGTSKSASESAKGV